MKPPIDPERERHLENLRAVYKSLSDPAPASNPTPASDVATTPPAEAGASKPRSSKGWFGGIGAAIVALLTKGKLITVLAGVLKFKTLATMLLSVAVYATQWGWPFATGFVLLIFVHELGHAIVLHHEGIPAGAPVFIPFVGALIAMRGMPRDAYVEAKVGIGGPILGSIGAWITLGIGLLFHLPLFAALGHVGILLNLFNMIPISPLDGGRIAGAFSRPFWIAGYSLGLVALVLTRSPILLIVCAVGLFTLIQRWRHPVPGYDALTRTQRWTVGLAYAGLLAALLVTLPLGIPLAASAAH